MVGVSVGEGVGVDVGAVVHSELHVGYAVRSVDPQLSYTPRLMQSARPVLSNACKPHRTRSAPTERARMVVARTHVRAVREPSDTRAHPERSRHARVHR